MTINYPYLYTGYEGHVLVLFFPVAVRYFQRNQE